MSPERLIYLLSPKELSPETIAVAFAKTSRSPESFREIAAELSDASSAKFHEKWVVGYGHSSVAEHAVLHLAIENVSRLAVESIESNRLASYTEKSTRYQKWGTDDFFIPPELNGHPLRERYVRTCRLLFDTYTQSIEPVKRLVEQQASHRPNEDDESYDRRIRSQYVDSCRFLLPAASLANLGMTANARVLENAIRKMLSHPLAEVRQIGEEIKRAAVGEVPTLVKYAEVVDYLVETSEAFNQLEIVHHNTCPGEQCQGGHQVHEGEKDWCSLVDHDVDGEIKVLAATLYRFSEIPYNEALEMVRLATEKEKERLVGLLLGQLKHHDSPLRELEHTSYTFDITMDQGAYAEFKRHRMMSQTPQALTTRLGYAIPRRITEAGFEAQYRTAMDTARETYETLAEFNLQVASYVVPNGFNRRVLATFNLREAYHFCQLRAATNAHFSIRRVAQRVAEEIRRVHSLLAGAMRLPEDETWRSIEEQAFTCCG